MIGHTTQAWCYVDFPWFSCESPLCVVINWIADSRCSHWCFSVCCQSDWMFQAVWLGGRTWTHPLQHYKASDWKSAIPALWQRNSSTNKFLWGHLSLPLQYATDTRWGLWNCLHPSPVRQKQQYKMFLMLNIGFQETVCCLGVHKEHMKWLGEFSIPQNWSSSNSNFMREKKTNSASNNIIECLYNRSWLSVYYLRIFV